MALDLKGVDLAAKVQALLDAKLAERERKARAWEAKGTAIERHGPRGLCYFHARPEVVAANEVARALGASGMRDARAVGMALSKAPGVARDKESGLWTTEAELARAARDRAEVEDCQALAGTNQGELLALATHELRALVGRVERALASGQMRPAEVFSLMHELRATAKE